MKLLIVSAFFEPTITPRAFRTTELVKEYIRRGYDVTVLLPSEYSIYNIEKKYKCSFIYMPKSKLTQLIGNTSKVTRLSRKFFSLLNWLFFIPEIEFHILVRKSLVKHQYQYDKIISIAYPHFIHSGVAAALTKNPNLAKFWIADCGDPFTSNGVSRFKIPFYFRHFEKYYFNKCDAITIPLKDAINGYFEEFHHKIKVVPQGFDFNNVRLSSYKTQQGVTRFAFAGTFIRGFREPFLLLDFLVETSENFEFYVYTANKSFLDDYVNILGERLIIKSFIPREDLIFELSKMDFLININNGTSIQAPSKLIDYGLTKRPILSINSFNLDDEILRQYLNKDFSFINTTVDLSQFNIQNVVDEFENII